MATLAEFMVESTEKILASNPVIQRSNLPRDEKYEMIQDAIMDGRIERATPTGESWRPRGQYDCVPVDSKELADIIIGNR